MKETVGIGIIGTGFGRKVQIPSFLECPGAKIVSVASGHAENAEATAKEFNIAHFTDDWRETISREDVDLICITTPPDTHYEMTLFAIEKGKHILCEKPMAMNEAQAREMTERANEKQILALIDHELRFQEGRQKAFAMLRAGEIGKIRHAKYNFRAPHRGDPDLPWNWWSSEAHGGGALGAIASHVIDSLLWFLGADISDIFCQLQTHMKQRRDENSGEMRAVTSDDEVNMIMRFAESDLTEDATGMVSLSMTEYPKYLNRLEFFGRLGAMRIGHRGEIFIGKIGESDWREVDSSFGETIEGIPDTGFARGFMEFAPKIIDAIRNEKTGIEYAATFEDGLKVQIVLDKARESDKTGSMIKI
jgi:predicted dehydrogenase